MRAPFPILQFRQGGYPEEGDLGDLSGCRSGPQHSRPTRQYSDTRYTSIDCIKLPTPRKPKPEGPPSVRVRIQLLQELEGFVARRYPGTYRGRWCQRQQLSL